MKVRYIKKTYPPHNCPFCGKEHFKRSRFCSPLCQEKTRYILKRNEILEYKRKVQPRANELRKKLWKENPEKYRKKQRNRYKRNIEKYREYDKNRLERKKVTNNKWRKENPEKVKEYRKKDNHIHKDRINKYKRDLYKYNIQYKLRCTIKNSIVSYVHGKIKYEECYNNINLKEIKNKLEKDFKDNINWDTYGSVWEIDHKIPCSWFDMTNKQEILLCWDKNNLQPKLIYKNQKKSNNFHEATEDQLKNIIIQEVIKRNGIK